jgi:pyruvate dehydrogenase E2 component (dihydrolipoamide acetyltransferase)
MAFSVQMPALGESVTEGTVTRWLKQEGDTVAVDEPLVEVSTDKVDTEIPSPVAGVLQRIVAAEDETVEVGGELAVIGDADAQATPAAPADAAPADAAPAAPAPAAPVANAPTDDPAPVAAAPAAPTGDSAPAAAPAASRPTEGTSVTMPALGESVTEGTVTRWLKAVGDEVAVDEPLLEVSTDKVDTEIPSPVAGTLLEISAAEDETVEVGGQLAVVGAAGAARADTPTPAPQPEETQSATGGSGSNAAGDDPDSGHSAETPLEAEAQQDSAARTQAAAAEEHPTRTASPDAADPDAADPSGADSPDTASPDAADPSGADEGRHRGTDTPSAPYVTPLVRKLATEQGVDLTSLAGTGVGGRIRKQDVEAAAEKAAQAEAAAQAAQAEKAEKAAQAEAESAAAPPTEPASAPVPAQASAATGVRTDLAALRGTTQKASRIRQITATKTRESLQASAQLTQTFEVDMSRVAALRTRAKVAFLEREGANLTFLPFFAKAVVEALKAHPNVNASYDDSSKEITYHGAEHLSIAVDTPAGLLSPVIHNAGDLSIAGLARAIADIASRSRANQLKPDELAGGTFTITNIGSQGALFDTPILVPPQAAMLGTGAIVKRAVVVTDSLGGDTIAVRSMCFLPLTYDHRLIDGADAGRFLTTVKRRLQGAAFEADLGL